MRAALVQLGEQQRRKDCALGKSFIPAPAVELRRTSRAMASARSFCARSDGMRAPPQPKRVPAHGTRPATWRGRAAPRERASARASPAARSRQPRSCAKAAHVSTGVLQPPAACAAVLAEEVAARAANASRALFCRLRCACARIPPRTRTPHTHARDAPGEVLGGETAEDVQHQRGGQAPQRRRVDAHCAQRGRKAAQLICSHGGDKVRACVQRGARGEQRAKVVSGE